MLTALRRLLRGPALTVPAIPGLALAIGAATAVFSASHTVLLRSRGIAAPESPVTLRRTDPQRGQKNLDAAFNDYREWSKQRDLLGVALVSSVNLDFPIVGDGNPQQLKSTIVSGRFFDLLGARPAAGRLLAPDDDRDGVAARVVISHRLWRERWG